MAQQDVRLDTIYGGWATYQKMLKEIIAPLSDEQLAAPVSSEAMTIGKVMQHVIANRVWWFQIWMGQGSEDLASIAHWDPADPGETPTLDAATLVDGLDSTWGMIAGALAKWTPEDLSEVFSAPSALSEREQEIFGSNSRQWIIWHVFEHEIHHGGEISLVLGRLGLPGIYGNF
ncbi:MAG: DinB family protein [Nitrolancea sp.]